MRLLCVLHFQCNVVQIAALAQIFTMAVLQGAGQLQIIHIINASRI